MVGAVRSPTAMRLMAVAAFRYDSSSVGDSDCASAMLSKFALLVSSGSQSPAFTSRASSSRMARSYSGRFRRWNVRRPGLGDLPAAVSSVVSSALMSATCVAGSGRCAPRGGIMPACSFTMIFSATSACSTALATSNDARDSPAAGRRSLWQPAQYFLMTAL
jgi:hypothetical protein